ncbi:unnamed protein product, partial [Phaeothamnion confervicola]
MSRAAMAARVERTLEALMERQRQLEKRLHGSTGGGCSGSGSSGARSESQQQHGDAAPRRGSGGGSNGPSVSGTPSAAGAGPGAATGGQWHAQRGSPAEPCGYSHGGSDDDGGGGDGGNGGDGKGDVDLGNGRRNKRVRAQEALARTIGRSMHTISSTSDQTWRDERMREPAAGPADFVRSQTAAREAVTTRASNGGPERGAERGGSNGGSWRDHGVSGGGDEGNGSYPNTNATGNGSASFNDGRGDSGFSGQAALNGVRRGGGGGGGRGGGRSSDGEPGEYNPYLTSERGGGGTAGYDYDVARHGDGRGVADAGHGCGGGSGRVDCGSATWR